MDNLMTIFSDSQFSQNIKDKISTGSLPDVIQFIQKTADFNEQNRVKTLTWLYSFQKRVPIVIGEILINWEAKLEASYKSAVKEQKKRGIPGEYPIKNLLEWFDKNPDTLPFNYKQARNYMVYREEREEILLTAPETLEKDIPVSHDVIIRKIKDDKKKEEIRQFVAQEGLTAAATKQLVNKINERIDEKIFEKTEKKKISVSVELDKNKIIIKLQNNKHRDIANAYIQRYVVERIKGEIIDSEE